MQFGTCKTLPADIAVSVLRNVSIANSDKCKSKVSESADENVYDWYSIAMTSKPTGISGEMDMTVERPDEKAERQLMALLRLKESEDFDLSVVLSNGEWIVRLEDRETFTKTSGRGRSFAEAWHRQALPRD
jgi:nitrogen fixation protein FixH